MSNDPTVSSNETPSSNVPATEPATPASAPPSGAGPLAQRKTMSIPTGNRRHITSGSSSGGSSGQKAAPPPAGGTAAVNRSHAGQPKKKRDRVESADEAPPGSSSPLSAANMKKAPTTEEMTKAPLPPKPSRRDRLSQDMEDEFNSMFGDKSVDDLITSLNPATVTEQLEVETRRHSPVIRIHGDNVFFALDGRNEGVVSLRQFATPPEPGTTFDVIVRGFNAEDGLYELSVPGASIEVSDWSDLSEGAVVNAKVTAANTGGLECEINKIRGFIPASQVSMYRVEDFSDYVGQQLLCVVTEANPQRRNLVLSHRAVLEREKEASREKFYETLEVGQIHEGVVRKIHDFGAFVDMGGADGLIHISQLSWDKVKHPSDVLTEGQKVSVRIERFDPETGKISLSYRNVQENPWTTVDSAFPVGTVVKGTVTRTANYGAFVKIAPGIEGLIHVSELAHYRVSNINKVVQEGQEVEAKVLAVDAEAQRISLSLKATLAKPEAEKSADSKEPEAPPPKSVVPKRQGPLKGGIGRSTGGDNFGLKW